MELIKGHGTTPIKAFFIGDAAEGEDLKVGYALSGEKQRQLRVFCSNTNLQFDNFYKTLLIKEEPKIKPININYNQYIQGNVELVAKYGNILIEEINELKPNLLIPLGELSFNFLTNLRGIRKFRGSVLPPSGHFSILKENTKVLPILGPYPFLYQDFKLRFITGVDFTKIPRYLNDNPVPDKFYKCWVAYTAASLRAFLERSYKDDGLLVFDIETFFGIPTCISFCFDGYESVCIPILDSSIDLDNRALMLDLICRILKSPIRKVNQNIKYDWKILKRWGFIVNNVFGDTQLAAGSIYPEFPKNLGFLVSIYTDLPYFKDEGREFDPTKHKKEQFYLYNAKDSLGTHQTFFKQQAEIDELNVRYVYNCLVKLIPIYMNAEERGILVDLKKRDELLSKYYSLFEIECKILREFIDRKYINPLSHVQCRQVIYDEIGYEPVRGVKRTKSGEPSTDEDSLMMLKLFGYAKKSPTFGPLIIDSIINCRKLHKVIELLELPLYPDNRMRFDYNLVGTTTGRTSGSETLDQLLYFNEKNKIETSYLGHSPQTIGKHGFQYDNRTLGQDVRSMYIATPGYRFVEIDLSGAEARVDAVLAGITNLSYFTNPGIHKLTGSWCFDVSPSEIKKGELVQFGNVFIDRYHVAKQVRHAAERNITAAGLVTKLLWGLTIAQGELLLGRVHRFQPEIRAVFHKDVVREIDTTHALISPNGRRRDFFDRLNKETYNEAISQLPQSIVSDQTKFEGILKTFEKINWAYFIAESHDSCLAEVPIGREKEYIEIYKENVETEIDFNLCSIKREFKLIIPSEASVGEDWYNMEDVK